MYSKADDGFRTNIKFAGTARAVLAAQPRRWRGLDLDDLTLMIQGAHMCLSTLASAQRTDGFLTAESIRTVPQIKPRILDALCTPALDRPALLHRAADPGPPCRCLTGRPWPEGMDYAVHDYLQWNRTAQRYRLESDKARERNCTALRLAMYVRDRGHCRYCARPMKFGTRRGSGQVRMTAHMDHVDPGAAIGLDGVVTACPSCDEEKGANIPADVGKRLLSLGELHATRATFRQWDASSDTDSRVRNYADGNPDQVTRWDAQARAEAADLAVDLDAADQPADHSADQVRDHTTISGRSPDPIGPRSPDPNCDPDPDPTDLIRADRAPIRPDQREFTRAEGHRTGQDSNPDPEPHPSASPVDEHAGLSGNQSRVLCALSDHPARVLDLAHALPGLAMGKIEAALRYLEAAGRCVKDGGSAGRPVTWRRARPP